MKFTEDMKQTGFPLVPAGKNILKVTDFKAVTQAGKTKELKATFEDSKGRKIFNRYVTNPSAKNYIPSMKALYSLLKTGCGLKEDADGNINEMDCIGKHFVADVKHVESGDRTFVNLGYIDCHATGFDDPKALAKCTNKETVAETSPVSIEEDDDDEDPYA